VRRLKDNFEWLKAAEECFPDDRDMQRMYLATHLVEAKKKCTEQEAELAQLRTLKQRILEVLV